MSTATGSFIVRQTTDAEFRVWCAGVIALLTGCGLTQTADTGQINTVTVTTPAGANASQGYVIMRFNDTLQATRPIYMKIEFGSGAAATTPATWTTFGTGSDGAGTLSGIWRTRTQRSFTPATTAVLSHACYNTTIGAFWMQVNAAYATSQFTHIACGRSCDIDTGLPTEAYGWFVETVNLQNFNAYHWDTGTTTTPLLHLLPDEPTTTSVNMHNSLPIVAVSSGYGAGGLFAVPSILGCGEIDWSPLSTFECTPWDDTFTYKAFTGAGVPYGWDAGTDVNSRAIFVWS